MWMMRCFSAVLRFLLFAVLVMSGARSSVAQVPSPLNASPSISALPLSAFARLPVLHDGRIKPISSFARAHKRLLSGREDHALLWLADTLFNPALGEHIAVIKLSHPDVLNMLRLPRRSDKLYTHREIGAALSQHHHALLALQALPQTDWSPSQIALARLQQKHIILSDLLSSLSTFLPLSLPVPVLDPNAFPFLSQAPSFLAQVGRTVSYWEAMKFGQPLRAAAQALTRKKGSDIDQYTDTQRALIQLDFSVQALRAQGRVSTSFRILPPPLTQSPHTAWVSPWALALSGEGGPHHAAFVTAWQGLAHSYHAGDAVTWAHNITTLHTLIAPSVMASATGSIHGLSLEHQLNIWRPLTLVLAVYVLACGLMAVHMIVPHLRLSRHLPRASFLVMAGGTGLLIATIAARVFILQRPPISTLYESILCVTAFVIPCALWLYHRRHDLPVLMGACIMGVLFMLLAFSHREDGDTLVMLTAVLNTNFWLATHVTCIIIGYGFCCLTSALAHYTLWRPEAQMTRTLSTLALLALLFTAVGTVLGGIWADQSWGRFWGWDPKENGALLIVLWLVWVVHGRISGMLCAPAWHAGLAYVGVITALSWFGVNLLNVGLHSYGFTEGAATALFLFIGAETVGIGALWWRQARQRKEAQ